MKRTRNSNTKKEIISLLESKEVALTHKDFQDYFQDKIDRVTIYRALDRLVEEGKLHKIANIDGGTQYALTHQNCEHHKSAHNHVHFSCEFCKKTICLDDISPKLKLPKDYMIKDIQIIVSGICPNCQNN
ncbi:MAG: transcriptional repressor [Flavobacteriaceae bacterium]|nr:transcriptional repressor [Flavobacteriaceae bacterium]